MREEIEARPAVILAIGLIIGLIGVAYPISLLFLIGFLLVIRPMQGRLCLVCAFAVGLAVAPSAVLHSIERSPVHGVAKVSTVPRISHDVQTCLIHWKGRTLFLVTVPSSAISLGDEVEISAIETQLSAKQEASLEFQSVEGAVSASNIRIVRHGSFLVQMASRWRRSFVDFFDRCLPEKEAGLTDALCFNLGGMLDEPTRSTLQNAGLIHILSASGLQIFVFGFLINSVLRFFPVTRPVQIAILASILVVYCLASGLNPAILRASFMTVVGLSAYLFRRDPDALSALALSGILYLIWNPSAIYLQGFQISFVSVACVALFFRPERDNRRDRMNVLVRSTNDFLRLSIVLLMAATPLAAYNYGSIPLESTFSNLLVGWSLPLLVGAAFLSHGMSVVLPEVGKEIASNFISPMVHWIESVLSWTGGGFGVLRVDPFSGYWLVAFYFAWAMTYRRRVVQP